MAERGGKPPERRRPDTAAIAAIRTGKQFAREAVRERNAALRRRAANIRRARAVPGPMALAATPKLMAAAGGVYSLGVLVAEGDSWFDYPGRDVLSALEDAGYDTVSVAHAGHTVESMAYSDRQLVDFAKTIEDVIRFGRIPKAILLSGGGNDVAGAEFGMLVNHRLSPTGGLNAAVVQGIIDDRIRNAYITVLAKVTET